MAKIGKAIIRAKRKGDLVNVKSILIHPNHTGLVKNKKTGEIIPAHFVNNCTVKLNGKVIYDIAMKPSVSKDPYLTYTIGGNASGELSMTWTDSKGGEFTKSMTIRPA